MRVAYTGREDFIMALDLSTQWSPHARSEQDVTVSGVAVEMRYWF
jgi:hypothetical protein